MEYSQCSCCIRSRGDSPRRTSSCIPPPAATLRERERERGKRRECMHIVNSHLPQMCPATTHNHACALAQPVSSVPLHPAAPRYSGPCDLHRKHERTVTASMSTFPHSGQHRLDIKERTSVCIMSCSISPESARRSRLRSRALRGPSRRLRVVRKA